MFITDFPNTVDTDDNLLKTTDKAYSQLKFPISAVDMSLELNDASLFPLGAQLITVENEIISCSGRSGNIFTVVNRGFNSTIPVSHAASKTVSLNFTSHHWNNLIDAVKNMQGIILSGVTPVNFIIPPSGIQAVKTISKTGFTDIDYKIKIKDIITNDLIKFNIRIIKVGILPVQTAYWGKTGTIDEPIDFLLNIYENPTDIIIEITNNRVNNISVDINVEI